MSAGTTGTTGTTALTRWQANALLLLAALIWGSAFVPQVWGMDSLGPLAFTSARFALGALVVAPLAWPGVNGACCGAPAMRPLPPMRAGWACWAC